MLGYQIEADAFKFAEDMSISTDVLQIKVIKQLSPTQIWRYFYNFLQVRTSLMLLIINGAVDA